MSAPLSGPLFHGTIETFKEGDVIKPRSGGWSWATADMNYALKHTEERTRTGFGDKPGGEYPVHHGNVYEVEPVGKTIVPPDPSDKSALASKEGFRVKRQVASVLGPKEDREWIKKRFTDFDPSKAGYVEGGRNG